MKTILNRYLPATMKLTSVLTLQHKCSPLSVFFLEKAVFLLKALYLWNRLECTTNHLTVIVRGLRLCCFNPFHDLGCSRLHRRGFCLWLISLQICTIIRVTSRYFTSYMTCCLCYFHFIPYHTIFTISSFKRGENLLFITECYIKYYYRNTIEIH